MKFALAVAFSICVIPMSAAAQSCTEDLNLTEDERIACYNYFTVAGKWTLRARKKHDDCRGYVRFPSRFRETLTFTTEDFWYQDEYEEGEYMGYAHGNVSSYEEDEYDYGNMIFSKGFKYSPTHYWQDGTSSKSITGQTSLDNQRCGYAIYCSRIDDFKIKFDRKKPSKFSGWAEYNIYLLDYLVCSATYKLEGIRRK